MIATAPIERPVSAFAQWSSTSCPRRATLWPLLAMRRSRHPSVGPAGARVNAGARLPFPIRTGRGMRADVAQGGAARSPRCVAVEQSSLPRRGSPGTSWFGSALPSQASFPSERDETNCHFCRRGFGAGRRQLRCSARRGATVPPVVACSLVPTHRRDRFIARTRRRLETTAPNPACSRVRSGREPAGRTCGGMLPERSGRAPSVASWSPNDRGSDRHRRSQRSLHRTRVRSDAIGPSVRVKPSGLALRYSARRAKADAAGMRL
jgi:hypothetical protein